MLTRVALIALTGAIAALGWIAPRPADPVVVTVALALLVVSAALQVLLALRDDRGAAARRYAGRLRP